MNRNRWFIPALAVILALVTTAVVIGYLQTLQRRTAVAPQVPMADVVVAAHTIATRHVITANDLKVVQVPASAVHPRALHAVGDGVNKVAVTEIYDGEQVIGDMLAPANVGASLSYVVPKGMLAVTIAVNEVEDVAGFIAPGDRVDVLGTVAEGGPQATRIFLQNVLVLAIAQQPDQKPGQPPKVTGSVTLALTPDKVEALTQIDNSGRMRLALRPAGSTAVVETRGQTTMTAFNGLGAPARPVVAAPSAPAPRPVVIFQPAAPAPAPSQTIEIWRGGQKQTVSF